MAYENSREKRNFVFNMFMYSHRRLHLHKIIEFNFRRTPVTHLSQHIVSVSVWSWCFFFSSFLLLFVSNVHFFYSLRILPFSMLIRSNTYQIEQRDRMKKKSFCSLLVMWPSVCCVPQPKWQKFILTLAHYQPYSEFRISIRCGTNSFFFVRYSVERQYFSRLRTKCAQPKRWRRRSSRNARLQHDATNR